VNDAGWAQQIFVRRQLAIDSARRCGPPGTRTLNLQSHGGSVGWGWIRGTTTACGPFGSIRVRSVAVLRCCTAPGLARWVMRWSSRVDGVSCGHVRPGQPLGGRPGCRARPGGRGAFGRVSLASSLASTAGHHRPRGRQGSLDRAADGGGVLKRQSVRHRRYPRPGSIGCRRSS
jgi:hypothetical protein